MCRDAVELLETLRGKAYFENQRKREVLQSDHIFNIFALRRNSSNFGPVRAFAGHGGEGLAHDTKTIENPRNNLKLSPFLPETFRVGTRSVLFLKKK